ncbi:MAG TPA: hypothetical protein DDW37_11825, partial [Verrucomicrobiales bacterium]|nr:hypothetical protein [Verrucomicrobiales bacterium]
ACWNEATPNVSTSFTMTAPSQEKLRIEMPRHTNNLTLFEYREKLIWTSIDCQFNFLAKLALELNPVILPV